MLLSMPEQVPLPSPAPDLPGGLGSGGGDDFGAASFRMDSGGRTNSSDLRKSVQSLNGQQGYEIMLSNVDASMTTVTLSDGPVDDRHVDGECWGAGCSYGGASIRMDSGLLAYSMLLSMPEQVPLPSPAPDLPGGLGSGGGDDFGAASFRMDSGGRTNSSDCRKSVLDLDELHARQEHKQLIWAYG
eukprot:gene31443-6623_t